MQETGSQQGPLGEPKMLINATRARVTVPAFKHDAIRLRLGVHNASLEIFGASLFASRSQAFRVDCHGKWAVYADKNRPEHWRNAPSGAGARVMPVICHSVLP